MHASVIVHFCQRPAVNRHTTWSFKKVVDIFACKLCFYIMKSLNIMGFEPRDQGWKVNAYPVRHWITGWQYECLFGQIYVYESRLGQS